MGSWGSWGRIYEGGEGVRAKYWHTFGENLYMGTWTHVSNRLRGQKGVRAK